MATVYDKSSLFLAPSGVNDGTVFTQKPVPIYGPELVTNGGFDTDSDWNKTSGATISGGKALLNIVGGAYTSLSQAFSYTSGRSYVLTAVVQGTSGSNGKQFRFQDRGNNTGGLTISNGTITLDESVQNIKIYWTSNSNSDGLVVSRASSGDWSFSIDNVSVKEVLVDSADFTFSRGSNLSATRVNADGLIEKGRENIVLHSNDFSQSSWAKLNGASVSPTRVADPFGGTDAWELTFATNNDSRIQQQVTTVNSTVYAFSVWARVTSGTKIVNLGAVGNLQQKTLTTTWQRIQAYAKETDVYGFPQIRKHSAEGEYTIQIYGFQLELGTVATDYIPTTVATGKAGILENTPRLDYSGGATCPSLLLESSRTNLITQSEYKAAGDFTNATPSYNATNSPEGIQNATEMFDNSTNGQHRIGIGSFAVTSGIDYTISAFVKNNDIGYCYLLLEGDFTQTRYYFNLDTGNAITSGLEVENFGNDWYRIYVTQSAASTGTGSVFLNMSNNGASPIYAGSGQSLFYYGFQAESGSYPTSYIPNHSGGSVTRGADECIGAVNANNFNSEEGVLYAEISLNLLTPNMYIQISDGTYNNRVAIINNNSSSIWRVFYRVNGVSQIDASESGLNTFETNKIAISWKLNEFKLYVNGVKITQVNSGSVNAANTFNRLEFKDIVGNNFYGNAKQVLVFKEALSDADCAILTGATTYETFEEMALALNYTVYE